jgi:hypothetical protein
MPDTDVEMFGDPKNRHLLCSLLQCLVLDTFLTSDHGSFSDLWSFLTVRTNQITAWRRVRLEVSNLSGSLEIPHNLWNQFVHCPFPHPN